MQDSNNNSITTDCGIEELRRAYDHEIAIRNSLDSKASTILGFATLVVTILVFILKFFTDNPLKMPEFGYYAFFTSIGIVLIAFSLILLINAFRIREYKSPYKYKPNALKSYLTQAPDKLQKEMIQRYGESLRVNKGKNTKKATSLRMATILLAIGVLVALISPLILLWSKVIGDKIMHKYTEEDALKSFTGSCHNGEEFKLGDTVYYSYKLGKWLCEDCVGSDEKVWEYEVVLAPKKLDDGNIYHANSPK